MPNTGKPSGGCDACRRMKVKCGEERPACARCERVGRTCRYRDLPDIFFSMNDASKERAENPPRRSAKRATSVPQAGDTAGSKRARSQSPERWTGTPRSISRKHSSASGRSTDSPRGQGSSHSAVLARPVSADWENLAISFYLSEFVIYPSENAGEPGHFDFLPDMLKEEPVPIYLTDALKSVALSAMGNRSCMEQLSVHARRCYGRALSRVNSALNDATSQKADATLVTLILLGQYEIISGELPSGSLWTSHGEGQAALLGLRGTEQFLTERGRALFRLAQFGVQLSSVSSQPSHSSWKGKIPDSMFRHPLGKKFYEVNNLVYETRRATAVLLAEKVWLDDWYHQLQKIVLQQGDILHRMDAMMESCQSEPMYWYWRAKDINQVNPELPASFEIPNAPLPRYAYVFTTLVLAGNLLHFWVIRAKLLEGLIDSAILLEDALYSLPPTLQPKVLRNKLAQAIDDLCAAMPFLFGELDYNGGLRAGGFGKSAVAYIALWPLHVLSGLRALDGPRLNWVLARITQIGTVYGVRRALHLKDYRLRNVATASISGASVEPITTVAVSKAQEAESDGPVDRGSLDSPRELWFPDV